MLRIILNIIFPLLVSAWLIQPAFAVKIVRLELEYGSDVVVTGGFDVPKTNKVLDLELFDEATPATVANYLNYVNSGRYDLTFISRSVPGFIIQTGGAANISANPEFDSLGTGFVAVEEFDSVINEPGISNTRGTIAMARFSGQIDSATSEWFINLGNNSSSLDAVDEGFTVFGSVIDDGMETADQVASFPVLGLGFFNNILGTSLDDLPIADADISAGASGSEALLQRNLIMILTATEITRPVLRFTPTISNFGFESTSITATGKLTDIVLKNTGNEVLDIGAITSAALESPFSIQSEDCSNTSLQPVSTSPTSFCTLTLKFLPTSIEVFNGNLKIDYTSQMSGELFSVKYPVVGEGALGPPVISIVDTFDVGTSQVAGFSTTNSIVVGNTGQASLQISAISGLDSTAFSQTNNCIGADVLIAPGETCDIRVTFTTSNFEQKAATLVIESNDPTNTLVNIALSGIGERDADGVATAIEDAAPNVGDNDFDGNTDSTQNNVASFVSDSGGYVSIVVDDNNVVSKIFNIPLAQLSDVPSNVEFKYGAFKFQVDIEQPGAVVNVGLFLPASSNTLESYYFYGETAGNSAPHWYRYESVQLATNSAQIISPSGFKSSRDLVHMRVQDGGLGDTDQTVNGRIVLAVGAPAYSLDSPNDGGVINIMYLFFLSLFLIFVRRVFDK
jgi:peptidyl-prolyl cis-trans isomerase A (cyclophilin A)